MAVLARNCIEYPLLYFAASKAGVVLVPLNYRSAPPSGLRRQRLGGELLIAGGQ